MPVKKISIVESDTEKVLNELFVNETNFNSLKTIVNKARENARGAQDHITKEVWEEINQMYHFVNSDSVTKYLTSYQALEIMADLIKHTLLYTGVVDITMPRGSGWWFMSIGKFVERCLQTIVLTEQQLDANDLGSSEQNDILQWRYLLLALSGYELHLKIYRTSDHNYNVLHQVLVNEDFSHSVVASLKRIGHYLEKAIANQTNPEVDDLVRTFGRLYAKVKFMDLNTINHKEVPLFLKEVKKDLLDFTDRFAHHFFSYS
jgi:uncharacterized alpha-E superfamily protein